MKNLKLLTFFIAFVVALTSCGIHSANYTNHNNISTNVELNKNNFKVVKKVSGSSSSAYILGLGGLSNKSLLEKAKSEMYDNAGLEGGAKAVINITTDIHYSTFSIFYISKKATVSGYLIEFVD